MALYMFATLIFYLSFSLLLYIYVGYPAIIYLGEKLKKQFFKAAQNSNPVTNEKPYLSIVVAAFNEEKYIADKITNLLSIEYPSAKYEIIIISDGSSDRTPEIVSSFSSNKIHFINKKNREGKAEALNDALDYINGEIVVYTDANVLLDKEALNNLITPFLDELIGGVSGRIELISHESKEPLGEGAYMKYERFLQKCEASIYSMVGPDGGFFAIRRDLVRRIPKGIILDDLFLASNIINSRQRIVYQENALGYEIVPASVDQEFRRKSRIIAGGFQILGFLEYLKHPINNLPVSFMFISHKLLRWISPLVLATLFCSNLLLLSNNIYIGTMVIQLLIYIFAIVGKYSPKLRKLKLIYICYYFIMMNAASLYGFIRYLTRQQSVVWDIVDR